MKNILIFKLLISCLLISFNEGQFNPPNSDLQVTDIYRTPAFFSSDCTEFPHYASLEENLLEKQPKHDEEKDSIAEGSEDEYSTSVVKNFYFHAAPNEQPVQRISKQIELGPSVQNYKVIFIKAPVPPKKVINLKAVYRQPNEKTVVYVLHKNPEDIEIESIATLPKNGKPLKPDVFFVKYNTGEEAEDIQKNIQAQYDYLGGATNLHHDEEAQTLDPISGQKGSSETNHKEEKRKSSRRSLRHARTQVIGNL